MSDIAELEKRINAALERIGAAVEASTANGGADVGQLEALREQLDEEKTANAQLKERVRKLKDRQADGLTQLEERIKSLGARAADQEIEIARLKQINGQLRDSNRRLREANSAGLAEPHLINSSMQNELESLRITYENQKSELDALLSELKPVVEAARESA